MKAKPTSLWGQIFMAIWIAGWSAYKFLVELKIGNSVPVNDIIFSGVGIAASFSPVYFSIMLDKIKDIKFGNKENECANP